MIDYSYAESGFVYGEVQYGFNLAEILDHVKAYPRWGRPSSFIESTFNSVSPLTEDFYGILPAARQVDGRGVAAGVLVIPAHIHTDSELTLSFSGDGVINGRDWAVPRGYLPGVGYDFYGRCPFTGEASANYSYIVSSKSIDKRYLSLVVVLYVACCGRVWFMAMGTGAFLSQQLFSNPSGFPDVLGTYDVDVDWKYDGFYGYWSIHGTDKLMGEQVPILELRNRILGFGVFPWKVFVIDDDLYSDDNFIKPLVSPIGFIDDTLYGRSAVFVVPVEDAKDLNKEVMDKYAEKHRDGAPANMKLYTMTEWIPILPFLDTV